MKYPSRKDFYGHLMLAFAAVNFALPFFHWINQSLPKVQLIILSIIFISISLLFFLAYFRTYYIIDSSDLIIRSGPIKKRIPISTITKVRQNVRTMDTGAVMKLALASRMLEIIYAGKIISISPTNEPEFINQLKRINSGILVRA